MHRISRLEEKPQRERGDVYARPRDAVDPVLFAAKDGRLQTYLAPLSGGPLDGKWAFAGGMVRAGEMLDDAARRHLHALTGLGDDVYLEQLFTFGDPSRDPTAHVVSVAYMALARSAEAVEPGKGGHPEGRWFEVSALPQLAYDHGLMAECALKRLKAKLEYTNIAYALLPAEFTFAQLEELYTAILGRSVDRRNFRRRIMSMGLLARSKGLRRGAHRPAALYSFTRQSLQTVEML